MPPRIEPYQSQTTARGQTLTPNAQGMRVISAFGEAAPALAGAFDTVNSIAIKRADEDARAWAQSSASKAQLDAQIMLDEAAKTASDGAGGFTEGLLKQWDKYKGEALKAAPNEATRDFYRAQLDSISETMQGKAYAFESAERDRWRLKQVDDSIDNDAQYLSMTDPASLDAELEKVMGRQVAYLKTLPVDPETRQKALDAMRKKLTDAVNLKKIEVDPEGYLAQNSMARDSAVLKNDPKAPRGIRNNNPGNLRGGGFAAEQGKDDGGYSIFPTPEAGLRAMAINLKNQQVKHGINTVEKLIEKYAPPSENNTGAYTKAVAAALGVDPKQNINLKDPATLRAAMVAMVKHENGTQPYAPEQFDYAVSAALDGNAKEPPKSATHTRTGSSAFNLGTWEQQRQWVKLAEAEKNRKESEQRQRLSEGKEMLTTVRERLSRGMSLPAEEEALVEATVAQLGEPKVARAWEDLKETQRLTTTLRQLSPAELETVINTQLEPAVQKGGATEREAMQLEIAQSLLGNMRTEINKDALSWGAKSGVDVQPVDYNDPSTLSRRVVAAKTISERYGVRPADALFTASEKEQLRVALDTMGDGDKLKLAARMYNGYGDMFYDALGALAEKDKVFTQAAWLATEVPSAQSTAIDIFRGQRILKEQPELKPSDKEKMDVVAGVVKDAFIGMPKALPGVVAAADSLYIARVGVKAEFDERAYKQAFQEVLGANGAGGGIGELNDARYLLPASMTEDTLERFLQTATVEEFSGMSVGGGAPLDRKGRPITPRQLYSDYTLRSVGTNLYALYDSDENPVLSKTGPGGLFVFRIDSAKAAGIAARGTTPDEEAARMRNANRGIQ